MVSIDNLLLARMHEIALADPGIGTYSILPNGSDFNKFHIDGNGDINIYHTPSLCNAAAIYV